MSRYAGVLINIALSIVTAIIITTFVMKSNSEGTFYVVALFCYVIGRDLEMARRIDKENKE